MGTRGDHRDGFVQREGGGGGPRVAPESPVGDLEAPVGSEEDDELHDRGGSTPPSSLAKRIAEAVTSFAPFSVTAFGGPPAHIAMLHEGFVVRRKWLDEFVFSEFFAISQALPGPGSTEMLFSIAIHRGGLISGIVAFLCWSLPGMIAMTGLGLGVSYLPNPLPQWFLDLQNGVSAAAVGLVAQAGTALSRKIVNEPPTKLICFCVSTVAVLWSAPWLEPVSIAAGGMATVLWAHGAKLMPRFAKSEGRMDGAADADATASNSPSRNVEQNTADNSTEKLVIGVANAPMSFRTGVTVFIVWLGILVTFMAVRNITAHIRPLAVFLQFWVAGSVIFGGGPVVIPLLYSYVVATGWLKEADFLLGIALIQAMPGPQFNIAAYCGALALSELWGPGAGVGGALLGYLAIFAPGLSINAAAIPVWQKVRSSRMLQRILPGMNAAAVGLVFASGYLLFQKSIVTDHRADPSAPSGASLGSYPRYALIAAGSYLLVDNGIRTPYAMLLGAVAGLIAK